MKTFGRILGLLLIAGGMLSAPSRSGAESLGAMRIGHVEGDVQIKIAETGEWTLVSVNMPLVEGDELWLPDDSRAVVQTSNGSHIRLDGGTALQILRIDQDSFQLSLSQGHAYLLSLAPQRSVLQLDTPDSSIRAFGSATFGVDAFDEGTDVSVFKGSVLAESNAGTTRIRAGDMLVLGPRGYAELSPLPPADGWVRWNRKEDRIALARGNSRRYLPAALRVYTGDFDRNGRWVYVREYGYCWTPTVVVIDDWAPYRHGRWVWRGGRYVWIGYEPWGWAPYHYGRWAFVARVGWCWVPPAGGEVFWGPGYVGWVQTPEYVAWVPLAPREVYYGYGHYGRYSVDISNRNINEIRVTNVYRNVNVGNSVTVVHHTTFVSGRPSPVDRRAAGNVRENFMKRRNIVPGMPRIKPVEASYAPVARTVPERMRPPEAVRTIDARKLRQSRPLVREADRSILRPNERSRSLEARKVEKPRSVKERVRERGSSGQESSRGSLDRRNGLQKRIEREPERNMPPETPKGRKGAESPSPQDRSVDRERPQRTTVGRTRPEGLQDVREPKEPKQVKGRSQGLSPGDKRHPLRPQGGSSPDRNMEREGKRDVRLPRDLSPEKEPPGSAAVAPEGAVERGSSPARGFRQAPPREIRGTEPPRKESRQNKGPGRAVPDEDGEGRSQAGNSKRGDDNGNPNRPSGKVDPLDRR